MKSKSIVANFLCLMLLMTMENMFVDTGNDRIRSVRAENREEKNVPGNSRNKITLSVNNAVVEKADINDGYFIPLQNVLETLGSEVTVEENTGHIEFRYAGIDYACRFSKQDPKEYLLICRRENIDSVNSADYIQLHPMCADGAYRMVGDRIYLYYEAGERLFEALGCKVVIDTDARTVKIWDGDLLKGKGKKKEIYFAS